MRSTLLALTLVLLATRPAHPSAILYASQASVNRIDAYCLGDNGGIQPEPVFQRDLGGEEPRRVLVHPTLGNVLYVAQQHRISVFLIDAAGRLAIAKKNDVEIGTIKLDDPRDLTIYRDMLYATLHPGQVVGFRLAADGTPVRQYGDDAGKGNEFETCIEGNINFQDVAVNDPDGDSSNGALVFTSGGGDLGRIDVFQTDAQGILLDSYGIPQQCPDVDKLHCGGVLTGAVCTTVKDCPNDSPCQSLQNPLSFRRDLFRPKSMIFTQGRIYVEQKTQHRITAYVLQPTGFCHYYHPPEKKAVPTADDPNCNDTPIKASNTSKGEWKQPPDSKTGQIDRYQSVTLVGASLIASQFNEGRLDTYTLKSNGKLPQNRTRVGGHDPRRNYIRMVTYPGRDTILYVAGGIDDRVFVYSLDGEGHPQSDPFSETSQQRGAFPNDVAVALLPGTCQ